MGNLPRRSVAWLLTALVVSACTDSLGPESPLNGTWTGSIGGVTVTLTLTEPAGGSVSGSGTVSGPGGVFGGTVTGTHSGATASLTLAFGGSQPSSFTGTVQADGLSMIGTWTDPGAQYALTLTRPKPA